VGRNEELVYDRGDILYMAGGTIAAIGDTLGHRWARYLDKDFWEVKLNSPEATEARAEWLRETGECEGVVIPPDSSGGYTDLLALLRNGRRFRYREGRRCPF